MDKDEILEYFHSDQAKEDFKRAQEALKTHDPAVLIEFIQQLKARNNQTDRDLVNKATYDSHAKALYIKLNEGSILKTVPLDELLFGTVMLDVGVDGTLIGIEILNVEMQNK